MSESKGKIFFAILAALLLLSGCIILLYPSLNGLWVDYTMRRDAQEFLSYVEVKPFTPGESIPSETISQEGAEEAAPPTEHTQLWLDMKTYNEAIFREGQEGLSNPTAYEESSFVIMKTGTHPMKTKLKLFLNWGIRFEKPLEIPDRGSRPVHYAGKAELEQAILSECPLVYSEEPLPPQTTLKPVPMPEKTALKT